MERERLGKYRILAQIGHGSMGDVYRAHDPFLNRYVAIKTMTAALEAEPEARKRFLREAQAAARLNHPNIITVYDLGEEGGAAYIAMELLEGTDLKDLIGTDSLRDLEQKLEVMEQICDGLAFAHSNDIVHRDLKPGNIHVQPDGHVKIMDFGLARLRSGDITSSGMVMGTPHYMSPEQIRGEKVDMRSDVFSLGAVFYELLSNRKPFAGDSIHTILFKVLQEEPEPLRHWVDLPPILVELVEKSLAKDPAQRFSGGTRLRDAVRAVRAALADGRQDQASLVSELGQEPPPTIPAAAPHARWPPAAAAMGTRPTLGAVALDEPRAGAASRAPARGPATVSGRAATYSMPRETPQGGARAGSRIPIYAGGAAALAAVGVVLGLLALRPQRIVGAGLPPKPDPAQDRIGALTQALVATQLELARKKLEDKSYAAARAQAERTLKLDPTSSAAKAIQEEAVKVLGQLAATSAEARSALAAGDMERSGLALWTVLSIDPNDPAGAELSAPLNRHFRSRAEEARRLMEGSRAAAERGRAGALESFTSAVAQARGAEVSFARAEFAAAARKFLAARDDFDRARLAAERR